MKSKVILILFLFVACFCSAQPGVINQKLDSTINAKLSGKIKFIFMINNSVVVDSLPIKKVQFNKKDSTMLITFSNKTQKRIKENEFWGVITDYGERRRLYKGRTFPLWKAYPPYFYRITKVSSDRYYFSETLTGDIYPLSLVSVNEHVLDPVTKKNLEIYIKEKLPKNIGNNEKGNNGKFVDQLIEGTIGVATVILTILGWDR